MRYCLLHVFVALVSIPLQSQVSVNVGYKIGMNTFLESKQDNLATEFNIGWDFDPLNSGSFLSFIPSTSAYTVTSPIDWDRSIRGLHLGLGFNEGQKVTFEVNFVGCTNKSEGTRLNLITGTEEQLSLKTKFGGIQFLFATRVHPRLSLDLGMGANMFRTFFSWSGATTIKNRMVGVRVNPLSGAVKLGDRDLTLTFPVGFTAKIIYLEANGFSVKARALHTFVWNNLVQTDLINFLPYSYKLNNTTISLILSKTI